MKIKIILFPSLVVIVVALIIWVVYPAYTNGVDGLIEKQAELKSEQEKLASLEEKRDNINSLISQLSASADQKKVLFEFLPDSMKEEEIFDNLNYLVSSEGLSISNISIAATSQNSSKALEEQTVSLDGGSVVGTTPFKAGVIRFDAKTVVVGKYEQIKSLVGKIYGLDRSKKIAGLSIKSAKIDGAEGQEGQLEDVLQSDIAISFNYLKRAELLSNFDSNSFSKKSFDMSPVEKIRSEKGIKMLELNVDQTGRSNPFLP